MTDTPTVLACSVLQGVSYPRLVERGVFAQVNGPGEIPKLPEAARAGVRVLITNAMLGVSAATLDLLPGLKQVVSMGAGTDRVDFAALAARGVPFRSVGEALTEDVADLGMALTLMAARRLVAADAFARDGTWLTNRFAPGRSLNGATMGIAGIGGRIGQALARRAVAARMNVVGLHRPSAEVLGFPLFHGLRALAEASDVLMLVLPGDPALRHAMGMEEMKALGAGGILVNIGRGELIDSAMLAKALREGVIASAGLDVVEGEPKIPAELAALPNITFTPHIGGATAEARLRGAAIAEDVALAALA
ncbi:NAD(P)-dependent oxidoreductase [Humitalea sp. 24SJ18S-53]|uniref:NAD(P)-dependent oxidoreductase n=1 Tax=Humitalea sp. 24SJ18S-53 TaxID=3422307 RepID=UPI003D675626